MLFSFGRQLNSYASIEQIKMLVTNVQKLHKKSLNRTDQMVCTPSHKVNKTQHEVRQNILYRRMNDVVMKNMV